MSSKLAKGQEPISYQALLDKNRALQDEIQSLKARLEEAEELKRAINEGDLDALIINGPEGELIFTLNSADRAYRVLVETMNEGTVTLACDGTILYSNRQFAKLLKLSPQAVVGKTIDQFVAPESAAAFKALLEHEVGMGEINLLAQGGATLPVYLSISSLKTQGSPNAWCVVATNLTEQKKSEEILAAERLARSIIEQAAEAIIVCDSSGKITRFSNAASRICGCDPTFQRFEDIIELRFSEGSNAGESILPVSSALKGFSVLGVEATLELENCRKMHLLLNSGPLKNADGKIIGCVITLTDITEHKRIKEELRESEERLRLLGDNLPDSAVYQYAHEPDGSVRFLYCSEGIKKLNGISPADVLCDPGTLHRQIPQIYFEQLVEAEARSARELSDFDMEIPMQRPDGQIRWMRMHSRPRRLPNGRVIWDGVQIDITEHKQAEMALIESQEKYRAFFENSIDAVLLTSPDGSIYAANSAACQIFEMTEEEIIRAGRNGIVDISDPRLQPALQERVKTGKFKGELNFRRKDGTIFLGEVSTALFTDRNGLVKTFMIIRDITERKKAEEALRESEERYRTLFTNMTEGFVFVETIYDKEGKPYDYRFLEINPAYELETSIKKERLLGKSFLEVFPNATPILMQKLEKVALSGQPMNFEIFSQAVDKYFEIYAFVPEKGKLAAVIRDITERKLAEKKLSENQALLYAFLEQLPVGLGLFDTEGHWILSNNLFRNFVSEVIPSRDPENNWRWRSWGPDGHLLEKSEWVVARALRGENVTPGLDFLYRFDDGREIWTRVSGTPFRNEAGEIIGAVSVIQDIDKQKRAEEALVRSENEFRALAENSPDVIARFDRQNRHIYINPAAAEPYGRPPQEIIGKTHSELGNDPELVKFWEEHHQKVFVTGKPETMEFQYTSPQGKKYYFNTRIVPEFADSRVTSVLAISRDISDIKKAEAELQKTLDNLESLVKERTKQLANAYKSLKESERGLAEAQKMAHLGNWDRDILTGEIYWSDEVYRIFGHSPQEFRATYDSLLDYIHPDDRDYVERSIEKALNGQPYDINYRITSTDGTERIIRSQGEVTSDEEGNPVRIKGTVQDITGYKQMEAALELVARLPQENPDPVLRLSQGRIINYANDAAGILLTDWGSAVNQEAPREITELAVAALNDGFRREIECAYADHTYLVNIAPFPQTNYVNLYAHDITESKKAQEALEEMERIRIKEIHHRIKNNLQVISSLLSLEADRFSNAKILEAFKESQSRVASMALIHEELYKGGKTDSLDFGAYLRRLTAELFTSYSLGNDNISLNMDLEPVYLDMDTAIPLGIIVNELVSNTLKHAFPAGSEGKIYVSLHTTEDFVAKYALSGEDPDCIKKNSFKYALTVMDNGRGISEEIGFENSDSLGLQLVNILVEQIDGYVELKRDRGTEFVIWFGNGSAEK